MKVRSETTGWAIKSDTTTNLDGRRVYLMGTYRLGIDRPEPFDGYNTMVFRTRQQARDYIKVAWGYTKERPDLRREPHCWRMPKPVKVTITVQEQS